MNCKYSNWMEQKKCVNYKPNIYGRCKHEKDCKLTVVKNDTPQEDFNKWANHWVPGIPDGK